MKRENLQRANEIEEELNKLELNIEQIRTAHYVSFTRGHGSIVLSYELPENDLAASFATRCISEKQKLIEKLLKELETL